MAHGINEYSGRTVIAADVHLKNGFRVIGIDMPSFGRSSGLHGYLPTLRWLEGSMNAVMLHVRMWDEYNGMPGLETRKRFAQGASMYVCDPLVSRASLARYRIGSLIRFYRGGFTCAYHAALHPPPSTAVSLALDGIGMSAPMLQISPVTRPNKYIEAAGRLLSMFAGRLGLIQAIRGHLSEDPKYVPSPDCMCIARLTTLLLSHPVLNSMLEKTRKAIWAACALTWDWLSQIVLIILTKLSTTFNALCLFIMGQQTE